MTCCLNKGKTPTVRSEHVAGSKMRNTSESSIGAASSQKKLSKSDQSDHSHDLGDSIHQRKLWENDAQQRCTKDFRFMPCWNKGKCRQRFVDCEQRGSTAETPWRWVQRITVQCSLPKDPTAYEWSLPIREKKRQRCTSVCVARESPQILSGSFGPRYTNGSSKQIFYHWDGKLITSANSIPKGDEGGGLRGSTCVMGRSTRHAPTEAGHNDWKQRKRHQDFKAFQSKKLILGRPPEVKEKDADKVGKHWTKTMKFRKKYNEWRPVFIEMMQKFEFMWDKNLNVFTVVRHRIVLSPQDALWIHSAPYRAGPKYREPRSEEVAQMKKAGVAEHAVTERVSLIVFVPKKNGRPHFCVDYCRLKAFKVRDSYPIPPMDDCIDFLG